MNNSRLGTIKPKIILLIPELGYGGAEGDLIRLGRFLESEFLVTIIVFRKNYKEKSYNRGQLSSNSAIEVIETDTDKSSKVSILRWLNRLYILKKYRRNSVATLSFLSGANLLNALTSRLGGRTLISVRGSRLYDTNLTPFSKVIWRFLLDQLIFFNADLVIPASKSLANEVIKNSLFFMQSRVYPIPGSIDLDALLSSKGNPDRESQVVLSQLKADGYFVLMSCGRLSKEKGFDFLIDQFKFVRESMPKLKLVLIGDGPEHENLVNRCESSGLSVARCIHETRTKDVTFLGYFREPIRILSLANLLVFTSRTEGLPNALIEGIASGRRILATDCKYGPREIYENLEEDFGKHFARSYLDPRTILTILPAIEDPDAESSWRRELSNNANYICTRPIRESDIYKLLTRYDVKCTGKSWIKIFHYRNED